MTKRIVLRLIFFAYLVALLIYIASCLVKLAYDRAQPEIRLSLESATPVALQPVDEGKFLTESDDSQLLFENVDAPVRRIFLYGQFDDNPGELDLYYAPQGQSGFSPRQRVWAIPFEGGYQYTLPLGQYSSLRIDTGTVTGLTLTIQDLVLNPRMPVYSYFLPSMRTILTLLLVPALASCGIYFIIELIQARKENPRHAK